MVIQGELVQVCCQFLLGILGKFGKFGLRRSGAMGTFDSIFCRIKAGALRVDWALAGPAVKADAVVKTTSRLENIIVSLFSSIIQGPLVPAWMRDWPSAESAKPRNAFTAGSIGLR